MRSNEQLSPSARHPPFDQGRRSSPIFLYMSLSGLLSVDCVSPRDTAGELESSRATYFGAVADTQPLSEQNDDIVCLSSSQDRQSTDPGDVSLETLLSDKNLANDMPSQEGFIRGVSQEPRPGFMPRVGDNLRADRFEGK